MFFGHFCHYHQKKIKSVVLTSKKNRLSCQTFGVLLMMMMNNVYPEVSWLLMVRSTGFQKGTSSEFNPRDDETKTIPGLK